MVIDLPANAPKSTGEAFAYVSRLGAGTTIADLRILALVEAIAKTLYDDMADNADDPAVAALLRANGLEELLHAHRVSAAIELLTGTPFPIPPIEHNPLYTPLAPTPVTREALAKLAEGEFGGDDLYAGIAASFDHAGAVALFRQNGAEELGHGERLMQAAALLPA